MYRLLFSEPLIRHAPLPSNKVCFLDNVSRIANERNINHFPLVRHGSQTLFLCLFVERIQLSRPGNVFIRGREDFIRKLDLAWVDCPFS